MTRIIIRPGTENTNYWSDLWNYRGLFYFLSWRDILVRYKQTVIGIAWSVIRPLITICAMSFIGWIFNSPTPGNVPRLLLVACATLPWQFFATSFSEASNSLIVNSNLLTKVYFPRLIVPASTIIVSLIDFLITLVLVFIFMIFYGYGPGWNILLMPLLLLFAIIVSTGAGFLIAALNVKYRDFRYIVPFIIQFGLFLSPIAFTSSDIYNHQGLPEIFKVAYSLNPLVGIIDGFRWCLLGDVIQVYMPGFFMSVVISFVILGAGITYFRKTEKYFADNI